MRANAFVLRSVHIGDRALLADALLAEQQFLDPESHRDLVRNLVRRHLAREEAKRLELTLPAEVLQGQLEDMEAWLRQDPAVGADLETWSLRVHGRPWSETRLRYAEHLADNLSYQLAVRAEGYRHGRVRLWLLAHSDVETAEGWRRSLQSGQDPAHLMESSMMRGSEADGSYAPMATFLPAELGEKVRAAAIGEAFGPLQLPGDSLWWVGQVIERLPPQRDSPPSAVLLAELARHPIGPMEARAWFEEMCSRYTASAELAPIPAPSEAFVPLR